MQILRKSDTRVTVPQDYVLFPIDATPKGVETVTLYGDELELVETGWTNKDGMQTYYEKYKLIAKET